MTLLAAARLSRAALCGAAPFLAALWSLAPAASAAVTVHHGKNSAGGLSSTALAIAVAAAVVLAACVAWALARALAYEPRWWLSLRHALAEAGSRMSATWAEFGDWMRLGH